MSEKKTYNLRDRKLSDVQLYNVLPLEECKWFNVFVIFVR